MKRKIRVLTALTTLTCFIGGMLPCVCADSPNTKPEVAAVSSVSGDAENATPAENPMIKLVTESKEDLPDVQHVQTNTAIMDGDVIAEDDFEDGMHTDTFTNLGWGNGSVQRVNPEVTDEQACGGNKSLALTAMPTGFNGVRFKQKMDFSGNDIYEVSFKVKASDDFAGKLHLSIFTMPKDNSEWWRIRFLPGDNGGFTPVKGEWTEFRKEILISQLKDTSPSLLNPYHINGKSKLDNGQLYIAVDSNGAGVGKLYIDDIQIRKINEELEYPPKVNADDSLFWYTLGSTVTLTPEMKVRPNVYPEVVGYFYDVHGNVADTVTYTAEQFNNGIKWTPTKAGYYEYQFALIDANGGEHPWYEWYSCFEDEPKYFYRRSLVITPHDTKPMSERRPGMGGTLSAKGYVDKVDDVEMWDRMGFSTLRLHSMMFTSAAAYRSDRREIVGKEKGVYDFKYYDELFNHAKEYGFDDIEVTMVGVPDWANPTTKENGQVGNGQAQAIDDTVFVNQVRAAAEHFKGTVKYWELFNEPGLPGESMFFLSTPERYAALHKAGYKAIKEADPNAKVSFECPVGATFPGKQMDLGIYDYFDTFHTHGMMGESAGLVTEYRDEYRDNEPKPMSNTEMHAVLRRAKSTDSKYQLCLNEAQMAIVAIKSYLIATKANCERMILFGQVAGVGGDDIERAVYNQYMKPTRRDAYDNNGIFRVRPVCVPRMAAMAIWQFVDHMGNDYEYVNEHKHDDNQNVVHVKNDGKDELVMWLDFGSDKPAKLSSDITKHAGKDFKIVDFEFNEIDTSDLNNITLEPDKLYYVTGIDGAALENGASDGYGKSPTSGAKDMRFAKVLYNYQMQGIGLDIDPNIKIPEANANKTELFDPKTFELHDNIDWIENDIKWVQNATRGEWPQDITAKFAVYMDGNRMQVVAKVYGDEEHRMMGDVSKLWWGDSLQIGLDAFGLSSLNGRVEFLVGGRPNGTVRIWKDYQPDDNALVNPDLTKTKKEVPKDHGAYKVTFETNADGINETTYYVEIPSFEYAPYSYPATDAEKESAPLRFSLLINQNENAKGLYLDTNQTHVRTGYLEWSTGIGGDKEPWYYGKIHFPTSND